MKRLAVVGFPFDDNSSFMRGAAEGPPLIRQAFYSDSSNLWTESGLDLGAPGIIHDAGDLERSVPESHLEIQQRIAGLLAQKFTPVCLGGDHSITYPIVKAFGQAFPGLVVVHFDAHSDVYDEFQGNRFSHACPFARIMEERLASRLIQIGLRTITGSHRAQIRRFGIEVIEMKDWPGDLTFNLEAPVYISVDVDVLDPAFAPGVSHHEPGGCSTRQLLRAIQGLRADVVGADIVEFNPRRDLVGITAMACAKIMKELAAKILAPGVSVRPKTNNRRRRPDEQRR
jgi:agmatinase